MNYFGPRCWRDYLAIYTSIWRKIHSDGFPSSRIPYSRILSFEVGRSPATADILFEIDNILFSAISRQIISGGPSIFSRTWPFFSQHSAPQSCSRNFLVSVVLAREKVELIFIGVIDPPPSPSEFFGYCRWNISAGNEGERTRARAANGGARTRRTTWWNFLFVRKWERLTAYQTRKGLPKVIWINADLRRE